MALWATVLATAALVLVAAKAHGRQIRLEREQKGFFAVDFRRSNPAVVEAIWRRDRLTFWPAFAFLALGGGSVFVLRGADLLPGLPLTVVWAFSEAFVIAGLASWVRLTMTREGPLPWRRRAQLGSGGWWLAVVAAAWLVALTTL